MKYYDVSVPFSPSTPLFPGDPEMITTEFYDISKGDIVNLSKIAFGTHSGTHIDAPKHFFHNGETIDKITVDKFIGKAKVLYIPDKKFISYDDICNFNIEADDIILFKTDNGDSMTNSTFNKDFVYLSEDAAQLLVDKKIRAVGIDYLSVEKYDCDEPVVHRKLLGNGIYIIEGLLLSNVDEGEYEIIALPLKIPNGNGSPSRVVLISK